MQYFRSSALGMCALLAFNFATETPAQAQRAQMGGGLIEFLFTGPGDEAPNHYERRTPAAAPLYAAPAPSARYGYSEPQYDVDPAPRRSYPRYARGEPGEASAPAPARGSVDPKFSRQIVDYSGKEKSGTIIIDTPNKFLFLVQDGGRAIRYGIGVGRPGFTWAGVKSVTRKREWPDWRPPEAMLRRQPNLPRYMPGGPDNPLGARALYLGSSLYRIHGSNEPWTIGQAVSSGCIRMRNEDVVDLYGRVNVGTRVIVM
jgi:lipoprotein-anchoring transpeptidase ErfK/SrfK